MHRQGVVAWMLPGSHTLSPCPLALLTAKQWQHIHPSAISAETLASDSLRQQKLSGALTQHPLMHFSDLLILPQVPNDELTVLLAKPQLPLPLGQLHTQKAHCSKRLINSSWKKMFSKELLWSCGPLLLRVPKNEDTKKRKAKADDSSQQIFKWKIRTKPLCVPLQLWSLSHGPATLSRHLGVQWSAKSIQGGFTGNMKPLKSCYNTRIKHLAFWEDLVLGRGASRPQTDKLLSWINQHLNVRQVYLFTWGKK